MVAMAPRRGLLAFEPVRGTRMMPFMLCELLRCASACRLPCARPRASAAVGRERVTAVLVAILNSCATSIFSLSHRVLSLLALGAGAPGPAASRRGASQHQAI